MTVAYDILATGSNLRLKQDYLGISSIVLVHAGGAKMLFDTGGYIARYGLLDALKARGLAPGDIDIVFLSHLHFDHSQNIDLFRGARVLVSREEWAYAEAPHADDLFMPWQIHHELDGHNLELIQGEGEIAPGVSFFPAPGHTPGCYAVRLETGEHGTVVLAGDAIKHAKEALTERCDMAFDTIENGTESIRRILGEAERIVPGHFQELVRQGDRFVWEDTFELTLVVR